MNQLTRVVCLQCRSENLEPYGHRILCKACGYTFHVDSETKDDETIRRLVSVSR